MYFDRIRFLNNDIPFFSTEMARWTARNAVSGPIHVSYHLASETPVGKWRLSANTRSNKQANPSQLRLPVVKYEPVGFEVSRNRIYVAWS